MYSLTKAIRYKASIIAHGSASTRKWACLTLEVHDLKHTVGRRLRAADVPLETRKVLLGHRNGDITTYYSAPDLKNL
jgi:integrase